MMRSFYSPAPIARFGRRNDFVSMYANCFSEAPQDPKNATYRQIKHEWDTFLQCPTAVTFVLEDFSRAKGDRICGCGQMVFVNDALVSWAHQTKVPGINCEAARSDTNYLLSMSQMREANSKGTLYGLVTRWHSGNENRFSANYRATVRAVLYRNMIDFFSGYYFREIIGETNGAAAMEYAQGAGFNILNDFSEYYAVSDPSKPRFGLVHMTRTDALINDGARISQIFTDYRTPRLHLTLASQELLQLAMLGYSDADIAELVGTSLEGVQKRWQKLSELQRGNRLINKIINEFSPLDFHVGEGDHPSTAVFNRNIWLRFARNHREELRPHMGDHFKKHIKFALPE